MQIQRSERSWLDDGESNEMYQTDVAAVNNWPPWFTTMNQGDQLIHDNESQ